MVQGMDQFSQPGYPKTAVPGKKLPGCRLVGGLPRTDLHGTNVTARGKGVVGLQATFSTSASSHAFPAACECVLRVRMAQNSVAMAGIFTAACSGG
jgi:hypothetical protein